MASRPFSKADPFLQLIILFLICFVSAGVFILAGQGLVNVLWGVDLMQDPGLLKAYENEQAIHINRLLLIFQHFGLFIVPAFVFSKLSSMHWRNYMGFRFILPRFLLGSIVVMALSLPAINGLAWVNQQMNLPDFLAGIEEMFQGFEENAAELTRAITETDRFTILFVNLIIIALIPAFGEEMIYRGLVLPILRRWTGNVHAAVWLSAAMFSAMHLQFYGFLPRLILGALLGYLFVWSRSIWAPIAAHFTNNALALILMFLMYRGDIPGEIDEFNLGPGDFIWLFISLVGIFVVIRFLLRSAKGWKDNHKAERLRYSSGEEN